MRQYIAVVRTVSTTGQLDVSFPDLPDVAVTAATLAEAKLIAADELTQHLERMIAAGETIPEPSTAEQIMADPVNHNGELVFITADA
ncbi:MAG: type II toxin-antitoxin system HicB family antitoxin [Bifidobacterium asteroides]